MHKFIKHICSASLSAVLFISWLNIEIGFNSLSEQLASASNNLEIDSLFLKILTLVLIFSPTLALFIYNRSQILTKYVINEFCLPLSFCICGFIAIWLIIDLSDNATDLADSGASAVGYLKYYLVQIPLILVTILPISILLSVIYSVGRLSKSNELISIQSAGKSYIQMLSPILIICTYLSLISLVLNYKWAPEAEAQKESVLTSFENGEEYAKTKNYKINSRLYRNKINYRSWFIGALPSNLQNGKLRNVEIFQTNEKGKLINAYYAESAQWEKQRKEWFLTNGMVINFGNTSEKISQNSFKNLSFDNWNETPEKIYSDSLIPDVLGVSNLIYHLKNNPEKTPKSMAPFKTHLHYRWALPFSCLAIAIIACPIGITNARTNIKGSGSIALLIYFLMMLFNNLFLALGQGMKIPPLLGAWTTNLILIISGIILFRYKDNKNHVAVFNKINILKSIPKKISKRLLTRDNNF